MLFNEARHPGETLLELSCRRAIGAPLVAHADIWLTGRTGSRLLYLDGLERLHLGRYASPHPFTACEPFYLEDAELTERQRKSFLRVSRSAVCVSS